MIKIEFELNDRPGIWEIHPFLHVTEPNGSGTALIRGKPTVIMFGWVDGIPGVWELDGPTHGTTKGRVVTGTVAQLADLRDGPYEVPGPIARWRFTLVADESSVPAPIAQRQHDHGKAWEEAFQVAFGTEEEP